MSGCRARTLPRGLRLFALLILMVGFLSLFGSGMAHASTPAIDKAAAEARELSALLDRLSHELGAATEDYNFARQQLDDTEAAVKKASSNLKRANVHLAFSQEMFAGRLVEIYKVGQLGVWNVILGAERFGDLITRLEKLSFITERDSQLIEQIESYKAKEAELRSRLEAELQRQEVYEAETAAARQKVLDQVAKQKEALKGKEAQIAKLRKAEAERQARLAAEERARKAFLASRPGRVVTLAMQYLGVPYVWGGSSPRGFDCSGLTQYVYAKVGVSLPHSSRMQFTCGRPVPRSEIRVGDLVFYYNPIQHVAIYIGNGRMIHATGSRVQITELWPNSFRGVRRVF